MQQLKIQRSQKEVAGEVGVSPAHLNRLVKGRFEPKVGLAIRLAQAMGQTTEEMWGHFASASHSNHPSPPDLSQEL